MPALRAYFFTNYYLSSIQQGIQTAHCVAEMFAKYPHGDRDDCAATPTLFQWAGVDKTIVVLNGGNSQDLRDLRGTIHTLATKMYLPFAHFAEDEASLNNAVTCVGIIIPEEIYTSAEVIRDDGIQTLPCVEPEKLATLLNLLKPERELAELIAKYSLAR